MILIGYTYNENVVLCLSNQRQFIYLFLYDLLTQFLLKFGTLIYFYMNFRPRAMITYKTNNKKAKTIVTLSLLFVLYVIMAPGPWLKIHIKKYVNVPNLNKNCVRRSYKNKYFTRGCLIVLKIMQGTSGKHFSWSYDPYLDGLTLWLQINYVPAIVNCCHSHLLL